MTHEELIEKAKEALKRWDSYQPDISTDQVLGQAEDIAEALRAMLNASPLAGEKR